MQFSCDQCKATLHIADDKVKGKRLVVRCKKCGNRITISDPALGAGGAHAPAAVHAPAALHSAAVQAAAAAPVAPAPAVSAPAALRPASGIRGATPQAPRSTERVPDREPAQDSSDSDTDATRAMDTSVLEEALRASKADDAAGGFAPVSAGAAHGPHPAPPPARAAPPAPAAAPPPAAAPTSHAPPPAAPAPAREPAIWFAMIGGKQTGPMTRAELGVKTTQGVTTARTYVWKDGMASWLRARELPDLSGLFGDAPAPAAAPEARRPEPTKPEGKGEGQREFSTQDFGSLDLSAEHRKGPGSSGIELDLGLASSSPAGAPAPKADAAPASRAEAGAPEPSRGGLPKTPAGAPGGEDGDRTHVEVLPLGERVHQEAVAQELFTSGEGKGVSAIDLAKWASSELSKKGISSPAVKKAAPPTADLPASTGPAGKPQHDAFAGVPELPGLEPRDPKETTGNILAKSGVHKSRAPLYLGVGVAVVAVLLLFVWALSGGDDGGKAVAVPVEVARPSLGGSGDANVGALVKKEPAGEKAPEKAAPPGAVRPGKKDPKAVATLTSDQEAAMKGLDNERGIGNHGPKGEIAAAPAPEKGDTGLTADDIKKKLAENRGALQGCIDEALRKQPDLKVGKIRIATTIQPSGQVTAAKIDKKQVDDSPLGGCLKRATRRIVFPSFSGEAFEVDIPIVVTAGE